MLEKSYPLIALCDKMQNLSLQLHLSSGLQSTGAIVKWIFKLTDDMLHFPQMIDLFLIVVPAPTLNPYLHWDVYFFHF